MLLERPDVDVNKTDMNGYTALHIALKHHYKETIKLIL